MEFGTETTKFMLTKCLILLLVNKATELLINLFWKFFIRILFEDPGWSARARRSVIPLARIR